MGRKQIETFKKLILDGLEAQPKGAGLLLHVFFADAAALEIGDDEVRTALAELYEAGLVHPWSQPRKLWQTGLALGPRSPRKRKGKAEGDAVPGKDADSSGESPESSGSSDLEDAS